MQPPRRGDRIVGIGDGAPDHEKVRAGFERILGWEGHGLEGRPWHDLCDPEHQARFAKAYRNLRAGAPSARSWQIFPIS